MKREIVTLEWREVTNIKRVEATDNLLPEGRSLG